MENVEKYFIGNNNYYVYYIVEDNNIGKLCFSRKPIINSDNVYTFNFKIDRVIKYPNLYFKCDEFIRGDYYYTFDLEFYSNKDNKYYIIVPGIDENGNLIKDKNNNIILTHKEKENENILYPEDLYPELNRIKNETDNNSYSVFSIKNDIDISEKTYNRKFFWILKNPNEFSFKIIKEDEDSSQDNNSDDSSLEYDYIEIGNDLEEYNNYENKSLKNKYIKITGNLSKVNFNNIILLDRETGRNYSLNINNDNNFSLNNLLNLNLTLTRNAVNTLLDEEDNILIEGIYSNNQPNIRIIPKEELINNDNENDDDYDYIIETNLNYFSLDVSEDENNPENEDDNIIYINIV